MNKSEAVREHLAANPTATAAETITALAAKGIPITAPTFYNVKGRLAGKTKVAANGQDAVEAITSIKALAVKFGGIAQMKRCVDAIAE